MSEEAVGPSPTPLWSDNPASRDLLGFADIAAPALEALAREKLDPVTIGVVGWWGSGKSTILRLIETSLREPGGGIVVVDTRPWEYDPATDPKATLIAEVLTALQARASESKTLGQDVKEQFAKLAGRVRWSKAITLVANSALSVSLPTIDHITGIFGSGDSPTDPTLQGFREEFAELLEKLPQIERVIVVVDDLDRCLPTSVIATLEAIKLFLSVPKMAFVLAYDDRLVTHAIAERYQPSTRALEMASEYLEKIVQIPVPVPTLGLGDTEAYLALTLLETHVDDDEAYASIVSHCDHQRHRGESRILDKLPAGAVPNSAQSDFQLAAMLAPILYRELGGNPRRLKRFLNAYWIRSSIAGRRGIKLDPAALAKLMVLEQVYPEEFGRVLGWLSDGELPNRLGDLEGAKKPAKGAAGADGSAKLREWAQLKPALGGVDLGPYLRLAASLHHVAAGAVALRADLRELADELSSRGDAARKKAQKAASARSLDDRIDLVRDLVRRLREEPQRQGDYGESIGVLGRTSAEVGTEAANLLREFDVSFVRPALPIRLVVDVKTPTPAMVELLREWLPSDRLQPQARRAIEEAAGDGGGGAA
ncbi:MAG: AAA family ATPase [Actinobacteria bacterium]|nr:AAA family ATPase [Actinomycetota bacterium]